MEFAYTYNALRAVPEYCGLAFCGTYPVPSASVAALGCSTEPPPWPSGVCLLRPSLIFGCPENTPSFRPTGRRSISVSLLALLTNAAVFGYMIYRIVKTKRNPYTQELYTDLAAYRGSKPWPNNLDIGPSLSNVTGEAIRTIKQPHVEGGIMSDHIVCRPYTPTRKSRPFWPLQYINRTKPAQEVP